MSAVVPANIEDSHVGPFDWQKYGVRQHSLGWFWWYWKDSSPITVFADRQRLGPLCTNHHSCVGNQQVQKCWTELPCCFLVLVMCDHEDCQKMVVARGLKWVGSYIIREEMIFVNLPYLLTKLFRLSHLNSSLPQIVQLHDQLHFKIL